MKDQFENVIVKGVHASRYIASWVKAGGGTKYFDGLREWLESLGVSEDEAAHIYNFARCGKLELETSAKAFLKSVQASK